MAKAKIEIVPTSGDIEEKNVEFTEGAILTDVLRLARLRFDGKTRAFINNKAAKENAKVPDGATIKILEPITGS